jgi:hypothetical protein
MRQFLQFILEWNSTCFEHFICPSSGVFLLYTQQWYMSYEFASHKQYCGTKAISMKYYECVFVVLVVQGAKPMHRIIFLSVTCLALPFLFQNFSKKSRLSEKILLYSKFILIFSTTFVWKVSFSKKNSAIYHRKYPYVFYLKYPLFL